MGRRYAILLLCCLELLGCEAQMTPAMDNTIAVVGNSGVSAQQMFLSQTNKVYILDKTEVNSSASTLAVLPANAAPVTQNNGNSLEINSHPAWAVEYDIASNTYRPMNVTTNSFCSGGNVLGTGEWLNVGGNQAVGPGGTLLPSGTVGAYGDADGGKAIRLLNPCSDGTCEWIQNSSLSSRRWYPALETIEDGSVLIMGGSQWGGYVNDAGNNAPTYEFYPSKGSPIGLNILMTTLPANLFPLIWLLPSGNIFVQTNLGAEIFDYKNNIEYPLSNMPYAVRTYPGSGATAMMPLTPANGYTATIIFCGGTNLQPTQWVTNWNIASYPTDSTCVSMTPDKSAVWLDEEPLPEGRSMGNWIFIPDGRLVLLNGVGKGTAGYGNASWSVGQSYGDDPVLAIRYFDYTKPLGNRFSDIVANSTVNRMYHSSATLLPDGSIMSAGSNPNSDYVAAGTPGYQYPTEYRVERFYPDYYGEPRPSPTGIPSSVGYGGNYFTLQLSAADLGSPSNLPGTKVVLIRTGFSTHAMNMGQRYVQLNSTYSATSSGGATLYVSQLPTNAAVLAPGPALLFVVVNGVPSIGSWVMVGTGTLGAQPLYIVQPLPPNRS